MTQDLITKLSSENSALRKEIEKLKEEISRRIDVEKELDQQRIYLELLIDTIPYHIFVRDMNGRFILANKTVAKTFRTSPEEMIGMDYSIYNPDIEKVEKFRRQDLEVINNLKELIIPEEFYTFPTSGEQRWLQIIKRPIIDSIGKAEQVLCVMVDITERKKAEIALRESEERFRLALEEGPVGMFMSGENLQISKANKSLCEMINVDIKSPNVMSIVDFIHPEDRNQFVDQYSLLFSKKISVLRFDKRFLSKNNKVVWVNVTANLICNSEGHPLYCLGLVEDISDRRKAEREIDEYRKNLEVLVKQRTHELFQRNKELEQEILVRKKAEISEHLQRTFAEALGDSAAILNSTLNIEEVLDLILSNIDRVVPHDAALILLIEDSFSKVVRHKNKKGLTLQGFLSRTFPIDEKNHLSIMKECGKPILISDFSQDLVWKFVPDTEWIKSYVGAPMKFGKKVIGFLCLFSTNKDFFEKINSDHLQSFANQASIAIRNATLYERARELATIEERQRLAREMHDAVSQTLFSACLKAETIPIIWELDQERAKKSLAGLHRLTRGALAEMRNLLVELRPQALINSDLGDLIQQLVEGLIGQTDVEISTKIQGHHILPSDVQVTIFRIAQEALNNISKYSTANHLTVIFLNEKSEVYLEIKDDGKGFDINKIPADRMGIKIMHERADSIGAHLQVISKPGFGTSIELLWKEYV